MDLYNILNKNSFYDNIISNLKNYDFDKNSTENLLLEIKINTILSLINEKYLKKETYVDCKIYTYSTHWTIYATKWSPSLIEILNKMDSNWENFFIEWSFQNEKKFIKIKSNVLESTLKDKENFKIKLKKIS